MEPGARLTAAAAEANSETALKLRVLQLQHLVGELLQKNQELRQALAEAGAGRPGRT